MSTPLVSVVLPVHNGMRYLREAVMSILAQTYADFELIAVDDGSNDGSPKILAEFAASDARVHVVRQDNCGLVEALKRGCGVARGKYIARMDADDVALPERLRRQVEYLERSPGIGLLGGNAEFIDGSGKSLCLTKFPEEDRVIRRELPSSNVFLHPTVMFRADTYRRSGGYREVRCAEDYDLWLRMSEMTGTANLKEILLRYRVHTGQVSVMRCREQALGASLAQACALRRRTGDRDPFASVAKPSEENLKQLGLTDKEIQTTLCRCYLACMRNLCRVGEWGLACETFAAMDGIARKDAERWVRADLYWWFSRALWQQKKWPSGLMNALRAIVTRPMILARLARHAGA